MLAGILHQQHDYDDDNDEEDDHDAAAVAAAGEIIEAEEVELDDGLPAIYRSTGEGVSSCMDLGVEARRSSNLMCTYVYVYRWSLQAYIAEKVVAYIIASAEDIHPRP